MSTETKSSKELYPNLFIAATLEVLNTQVLAAEELIKETISLAAQNNIELDLSLCHQARLINYKAQKLSDLILDGIEKELDRKYKKS